MIAVDIKTDIKQAQRRLGALGKKIIPKAARRAIVRTGKSTHSKAVREVAKKSGMKVKKVRRQLSLKIEKTQIIAVIKPSSRETNMIEFMTPAQIKRAQIRKQRRRGMRATPPGKGIKAKIAGKQKFVNDAFVALGRQSKKKLVFVRETEGRDSGLKAVPGVNLEDIFKDHGLRNELKIHAKTTFVKEFNRQLKFQLSKL